MPSPNIAFYAGASLVLFCSYKAVRFLLHPYLSSLRDIPGPKSLSIIYGHTLEIESHGGDESFFFRKSFGEYGQVIKVHGLFQKEFLVTQDTRAVNHVLTHSMDYEKPELGRRNLARVLGEGILVTEGDKHRQQRRIMNPSFSPATIKALTPIFYRKVQQLKDIWGSLIHERPEEPLEVLSWLSRATLDIIGLAGFDYQFDALNVNRGPNELNAAFTTLFHADRKISWIEILEVFFPIVGSIPTKRERGRVMAMKTMNRIGRELVRDRKAAVLGEKRTGSDNEEDRGELAGRDLLSALVKANLDTELPANQRMSDDDVLAQVPTFLIAGHETTSTETMWALFALAQKPETQQKLRDELLAVPTETPGMDDLNALPYLDAVVREALRVHAAVTAISRTVNKDDVIPLNEPFIDKKGVEHKEIKVKKGDSIIIPIPALNVSKDIWGEDADEFNPERWEKLPEAAKNIPGVWGHIMTFIGGARGCIGYRFALIEMKVLLFVLIRNFTFKLAIPAESFEKRSFIVTRPYLKDNEEAGAQMPLIVRPYRV